MNAKTHRFYKSIFTLAAKDYLNSAPDVETFIRSAIEFDYDVAAELWDYLITDGQQQRPTGLSRVMGNNVFKIFYGKSVTKAVRLLMETPSVKHLLYSEITKNDIAFSLFLKYLTTAKVAEAEEILKILVRHPQYGLIMKAALEMLFAELSAKHDGLVAMPKKLSALLLTYVAKIKTDERPLLEQRIKEVI